MAGETESKVARLDDILDGDRIKIESVDELRDTFIKVGCYRETARLDRMLRVFHKALMIARRDGKDGDLLRSLETLYDSKGTLMVSWRSEIAARRFKLLQYVERAWEDECECAVMHYADAGLFAESE